MLVIIAIITLVAAWIDLPGETLDIGGFKERHPVRQGLDLQGGLQVLLEANPPAGQSVDSNTMSGTRDTLERRVNGLGVSEPLIQTRGDNQIVVELPGVQNPDQAIAVLQETALLEIIDTNGQSLPARLKLLLSPRPSPRILQRP
jgi:preprotein translocase subunit SecD